MVRRLLASGYREFKIQDATLHVHSCQLSASSYVEAKDNREVVDIVQFNAELKIAVAKIDQLRKDIDAIVAKIEGEQS